VSLAFPANKAYPHDIVSLSRRQGGNGTMKKLIALMFVLATMIVAAVPASAALNFSVIGFFGEFIPDPDDPDGDPILLTPKLLAFTGASDGSAPTTGHYSDAFGSFDYSKFALSTFALADDLDQLGDISDLFDVISLAHVTEFLAGSDYFFFAAPSEFLVGFGKGDQLWFGGDFSDLTTCGCTGYDGTRFAAGYIDGGSFDTPTTFSGGDHMFDSISGYFIAADPLALGFVPEPASWALMLIGFGAVGVAIRRRRPAPARAA
jgi:hypothetical protein